ncbi:MULTISPECIES: hypothetical protein [unclassified Pseudonocardia]|uniref:hypothetical protein n=1 Tax=unclassified Pseudonocardia TaxID=2619320 RepID=UPI0011AE5FFE|nr:MULTISPECIES: hypothetical protein [unclassified Pseudonocardia]
MTADAYPHDRSTNKVDDLLEALGMGSAISKPEVPRTCCDLDTEVRTFDGARLPVEQSPHDDIMILVGTQRTVESVPVVEGHAIANA